jgi:uncharacterized protein YkwD
VNAAGLARPVRRCAAWAAVAGLLACTAPPAVGQIARPAPRGRLAATAADILAALDGLRHARGLPALRPRVELSAYAQERADASARSGRLELGGSAEQLARTEELGYPAHLVGAILAQSTGSATEVMAGWLADPRGTFDEALRADYRDVGVGVARPADPRQPPIYVIALGISWADYFAEGTRGLADLAAVRRDLVRRVNQARDEHRVPPLRAQPRLDRVAQDYAARMLREGFYDHRDPDGSSVLERVQSIGYSLATVGENLASGQFTVERVFEGWMESPDHRHNLLDRDFREVGHGVAVGEGPQGLKVLWVQVFATPR